ncbi:hypothetical protein CEXT_584591 [Caerostris extrusa]|uniref:Uncharacterized protein n=1 Tax=Caerostris extrusa TaxID=172846 RepID=A0AAV4U6Z1_CAEEX|nr:hypothetical protein CEXT_584591 [Caerostris extrusa]
MAVCCDRRSLENGIHKWTLDDIEDGGTVFVKAPACVSLRINGIQINRYNREMLSGGQGSRKWALDDIEDGGETVLFETPTNRIEGHNSTGASLPHRPLLTQHNTLTAIPLSVNWNYLHVTSEHGCLL